MAFETSESGLNVWCILGVYMLMGMFAAVWLLLDLKHQSELITEITYITSYFSHVMLLVCKVWVRIK
jgi:hypothetical protein